MHILQLLSGGFDSVGQSIILQAQGHTIHPMYIKFRKGGGKQAKEVSAMIKIAAIRNFQSPIIVQFYIPRADYETRNRVMCQVAGDMARSLGIDYVAIATSMYPGTIPDADITWEDMDPELLSSSAGMEVKTLQMHKSVVALSTPCEARNALFASTSCQLWYKEECGRCYRCAERHAGFIAGLGYDHTVYKFDPKGAKKWNKMIEQEMQAAAHKMGCPTGNAEDMNQHGK